MALKASPSSQHQNCTDEDQKACFAVLFISIDSTMASPAMENSENVEEVSEVQEVQGNKSWDDAMDEVEADHANEQESQRTSLITPQEDDVPVPDAIKRMMHNGANFTRTKESWNIEEDTVG